MATRQPRRQGPGLGTVLRRLFLIVVAVCLVGAAAVGWIVWREFAESLPSVEPIVQYRPPVTTQVFADDGTLIAEFFSEKRYLVPIERIPPHVRHAFIAAEDDGFYRHKGVDAASIARAFINNILAGSKVQGGSTITQQVVKSLLLSPQKSYERKIKEIVLSVRLEGALSKDEILGLYLNHIYLGSGSYGVAAAAREYFGKDIEEITVAEAALLAGLPQAPSRYSPFNHWPEAKARQRYVLNRMHEVGFISREERDAALLQPIALATRKGSFRAAPYFVEMVRQTLEERYGHDAVYELGLKVQTTVNLAMQEQAEAALRAGLDEISERHGGYRDTFRSMDSMQREGYLQQQSRLAGNEALELSHSYEALVTFVRNGGARVQVGPFAGELVADPGSADQLKQLQLNDLIRVRAIGSNGDGLRFSFDPSPILEGALVAVDPHTGYVKALVGGYDFDRSQFNRAVQAKRQPGSAFKPLVYAAAFDRNLTPATVVVDEPIYFNDNGKVWSPKNFENKYFGPTSLRTALTFSRNVVTVKVANRIGVRYLVKYLKRFGLSGPFAPNLSIALGSAEVTPLELTFAYAAFAAGGLRPDPIFITTVFDAEGHPLEENLPHLDQAIPAATAYLVTNILQDVIKRGTGRRADGLKQPSAGKTGTTNDLNDAWFMGFTPQLLAGVWVGFDDKRPLGDKETGGRVAAPIWKAFMEQATKDMPLEEFPVPSDLKCVNVDPATGLRAAPGGASRLECFRPGTEPIRVAEPGVQMVSDDGGGAATTAPAGDQPSDNSARDFLRSDF